MPTPPERLVQLLTKYANVPAKEARLLQQELDESPLAGAVATGEPLAIPIDYVNSTVDVPAGSVFATQADVDRGLAGDWEVVTRREPETIQP
jgi:hypothetical protein